MIENFPLSLALDILISVLLLVTIAYAVRLTGYLKRFKESRSELEGVIKELSKHIAKADHAMSELSEAVDISSHDLKDRMDRARKMFDELEIVVQTGDALANRLEDLAVRNRKIIEGGEGDVADLMRKASRDEPYEPDIKAIVSEDKRIVEREMRRPAFAIRDPEIERGEADFGGGYTTDDDDMLSEAERDLYEALQKTNKTRGGKK